MESSEQTRKEFFKTTAATGAAAVLAAAGFNRMADAAHHEADESITQIAIFGYDPAKKEAAAEGLAKLAAAVEAAEPDVIAYIPHLDEKNNKVQFFEIYRNEAALKNHSTQPHMSMLGPLVGNGTLIMPLEIIKLTKVGGFHR
ncbi:MAG: antibiotic biosynthesis monooxygenase [Candidatus Hydrogenedentota bacterium]